MSRFKTYRRIVPSMTLAIAATLALPLASPAAKSAPLPKPPRVPSASTQGTVALTYTSTTLSATVNPHGVETTYYFQYGPTVAYGAQTPAAPVGNGTVGVNLSQSISGLQVGAEYHYRVVAVSSAGTTFGQDRAFTTKKVPLKFEIPKIPRLIEFGHPISITGNLIGTGGVGRQVALQASPYPFSGSFASIGSAVTTNAAGGFSFRVKGLSQNTQLRLVTLGTPPTYSPLVTVRVAPRVTLHAKATASPGYVRFYGTIAPYQAGASVAFQLLRPGRGPLVVGGTVVRRGPGRTGRFSAVAFIRHGHGGLYSAFVKATTERYAAASSRSVLVHSAPASVRANGGKARH